MKKRLTLELRNKKPGEVLRPRGGEGRRERNGRWGPARLGPARLGLGTAHRWGRRRGRSGGCGRPERGPGCATQSPGAAAVPVPGGSPGVAAGGARLRWLPPLRGRLTWPERPRARGSAMLGAAPGRRRPPPPFPPPAGAMEGPGRAAGARGEASGLKGGRGGRWWVLPRALGRAGCPQQAGSLPCVCVPPGSPHVLRAWPCAAPPEPPPAQACGAAELPLQAGGRGKAPCHLLGLFWLT